MRPLTIFVLFLIASTFGQAQGWFEEGKIPFWSDSHGIINMDKAMRLHLEDPKDFIAFANKNYAALIKQGVVNDNRAKSMAIRDYVDFCDYLMGYWDTDYSTERPGTDRAKREDDADAYLDELWNIASRTMQIHLESESSAQFVKGSTLDVLNDCSVKMHRVQLVHDCSPYLRVKLPDYYAAIDAFIAKVKQQLKH